MSNNQPEQDEPQDEPTTDSWNVSDSANELGIDAFSAMPANHEENR